MNKKHTLIILIAVIIVGIAAYKAGQSHSPSPSAVRPGFSRATSTGAFRAGADSSAVTGEVLSSDDTSMTIRLQDSGSRIVFISASSTAITKSVQGSRADLVPGSRVSITGTANSDGSMSAGMIQIRQADGQRQR